MGDAGCWRYANGRIEDVFRKRSLGTTSLTLKIVINPNLAQLEQGDADQAE